ncbi:MAG: hypothetical protein ACE5KO_07295 [Candidatus Bathyarchaeia archaeon]
MSRSEFEALLDQLRQVSEDVDGVLTIKQTKRKLKQDITNLFKAILDYVELPYLDLPDAIHAEVARRPGEVDGLSLDRSGMLVLRHKRGAPAVLDIAELPTEVAMKVFNATIPILKDEIANKRKVVERNLEALQSIKGSLAKIEKRKQTRSGETQ